MAAAPVPKFVWSLALDFPDICPQFFLGNFRWREGKKFTHNTVYIFSRGCLPVNMASKAMIRFSAPLPISSRFRISALIYLIAHKLTVMPHYRNSGLMSMWVHKFFKRMISSSNFVAIARLARKGTRTTSPFSSLLLIHSPCLALCSHCGLF